MAPSCTRRLGLLNVLVLAAVLCSALRTGAVEEDLDYGKVYAIQNRAFRMNHEFGIGLAFLPLDAFYKFFVASVSYVLHFDDLWAWETDFGFCKYMDVDTGLRKELNNRWNVQPTDTPEVDYFFDTNVMVKPLYGKMALFDKWVIFSETYFLLGIGAEHVTSAFYPALDVGIGMRIFLTDTLSLRFEAREYLYFSEGGVDNTLSLGIGFSYNGFAEDVKVKNILEGGETAEVKP